MRLLNTKTLQFEWINDPSSVQYAILSHVWAPEGEQSFHDVLAIITRSKDTKETIDVRSLLSRKIARFCARALKDGFQYAWVDSCCIDKTSSAELSEALNSMFKWYRSATRCYAFLHDVDNDDRSREPASQFRQSLWFRRGWTLQELLAPSAVIFLSKQWRRIDTKRGLSKVVEEITGIDLDVLEGRRSIGSVSVARRMAWASSRSMTREEDEAYSLMGLFGVNMPTIYGEGRHAFVRLQEEIMKHIPDDTLFAWGDRIAPHNPEELRVLTPAHHYGGLFAVRPQDFAAAKELRPLAHEELLGRLYRHEPRTAGGRQKSHPLLAIQAASESLSDFSTTRYGVRAKIHVLPEYCSRMLMLGFLQCEDSAGNLVALLLRRSEFAYSGDAFDVGVCTRAGATYRLATLSHMDQKAILRRALPQSTVIHISRGGPDAFSLSGRHGI
ncbi:heterokaryon incompatibility protein-domain-containing protein [Ganoderma leucocontextum]|nr:heterokaryon incompatibility protein-domain-containing protein [Ganoderma leucocontextum]